MPVFDEYTALRELLLARCGVVFVDASGPPLDDAIVRAFGLELAALGYLPASRLERRVARCSLDEIEQLRDFVIEVLRRQLGDAPHEPLFRSFPHGIPRNTLELWFTKVLLHFLQTDTAQPCLTCGALGTTHVLAPCRHVVCDRCFDGRSYAACPVCEHHVDRRSPFFRPSQPREPVGEPLAFRRIELGDDLHASARALFSSLCARTQALSADDRSALEIIVSSYGTAMLDWLPDTIPVRENVAIVFGTLVRHCPPEHVLPHAALRMTSATDVLRFITVMSGADASLAPQQIRSRRGDAARPVLAASHRFEVAKLARPLRRMLLGLLERIEPDRLREDMLRHRSRWVWVGEFLHPGEYAHRFPHTAEAFALLRRKAPDGTPAPTFRTWAAGLEDAAQRRDSTAMLERLVARPGELARRLDHVLRIAATDTASDASERVVATFLRLLSRMATPVLLTLYAALPTRAAPLPARVYFPRGRVARGVVAADRRASLSPRVIDPLVHAIERELVQRFEAAPHHELAILDDALRELIVPFNARTAATSALALPRGSSLAIPAGKLLRLFLHWCQPPDGRATDLDLSVALYDASWRFVGVCSYYQLQVRLADGTLVAQSAGDLRDAPHPEGASEFVDLHLDAARRLPSRYAVAVVNAYAGLPFDRLERAFAGLMLRDGDEGLIFDPRTVALRFGLSGQHGVFLPFVVDLARARVHWLDMHEEGRFEFNNVETGRRVIAKLVPGYLAYFASGARPTMLTLARLHAAARCDRVVVRHADHLVGYVRREHESRVEFHARIVRGEPDEPRASAPRESDPPCFAALVQGDLELPAGSSVYALVDLHAKASLAAADLLR